MFTVTKKTCCHSFYGAKSALQITVTRVSQNQGKRTIWSLLFPPQNLRNIVIRKESLQVAIEVNIVKKKRDSGRIIIQGLISSERKQRNRNLTTTKNSPSSNQCHLATDLSDEVKWLMLAFRLDLTALLTLSPLAAEKSEIDEDDEIDTKPRQQHSLTSQVMHKHYYMMMVKRCRNETKTRWDETEMKCKEGSKCIGMEYGEK